MTTTKKRPRPANSGKLEFRQVPIAAEKKDAAFLQGVREQAADMLMDFTEDTSTGSGTSPELLPEG